MRDVRHAFLALDTPRYSTSAADPSERHVDVTPPRARGFTYGERALLLAVLEDAIATLHRCARVSSTQADDEFALTWRWFMQARSGWLCDFETICEYCGLDPDSIRARLRARFGFDTPSHG